MFNLIYQVYKFVPMINLVLPFKNLKNNHKKN